MLLPTAVLAVGAGGLALPLLFPILIVVQGDAILADEVVANARS
jgi:hypothetical protein